MNNQRLSHRFTLVIPFELWHRIKDYTYPRGGFRNATELGLVALEKYIAELDRVLPGFRTAWSASHSGNWPQPHEQYACYAVPFGPLADEGTGVHGPRFLLSELETHCRADLWNERTGQLVREHQRLWKARGVVVPDPPMYPPGWQSGASWGDVSVNPDAPPAESGIE